MTGIVGTERAHESAAGHVSGAARYTDDLAPDFHGLLHAFPVLSPVAHGVVRAIDSAAAEACAGVVAVLTAADVSGENETGPAVRDEPLFPQTVQFHLQPVCWVLAETEEQARQGAAQVVLDMEEKPAVVGIGRALEEKSTLTPPMYIRRGDSAAGIAGAEQTLEGTLDIGGQEHFYLEAQAAIATTDPSGGVLVYSSTQHPSETQEIVARVLGKPKHEVTCECVRMGGAFGGKEVQANVFAAVAALGAQKTGRPVRVALHRKEDMAVTGKRHPFRADYRVGFDAAGKILGLDVSLYSDGGYSADLSRPVMWRAMFHIDNCYYLPNVTVMGQVMKTHKASNTAFRGFGGPQGMLAIEEVMDRVAEALGASPEEVRAANFYSSSEQTAHYGQKVRDAERIQTVWAGLHDSSEWAQRRAAVDAFNAANPHKKRGLAMAPVKFGISFTTAFFNQAGALVLIYKDGTVQVNHGGTEMGQGLQTKIQQIAADALGVPASSVRVMATRTDKVPNTSATAASSGTDLNGAAVLDACGKLRARLVAVAAEEFGCSESEVQFDAGTVSGGGKELSFEALCVRAYLERNQLFASGYYRTPDIHFDEEAGQGKPFHYFAYGAAVSEVEVDTFTGQYELRRVDILHDVGDSISPLIDRGQIEGGFVQGWGWLTREELVFDDAGRLRTSGASTYKLPGYDDCPEDFRVTLLKNATESSVVHGSKAVGEPPFMLANSARYALKDAIRAFRKDQKVPMKFSSPATPEQVFWALTSEE